ADDAVGVGALVERRLGGPPGEQIELVERPGVEQQLDALPGEKLAPVVLALARPVGAGSERFLLALHEVGEALAHRVVGHGAKRTAPPGPPEIAPPLDAARRAAAPHLVGTGQQRSAGRSSLRSRPTDGRRSIRPAVPGSEATRADVGQPVNFGVAFTGLAGSAGA